jgi:hypothetical protein
MYRNMKNQAAQRSADHRRREDEAQRLCTSVPGLTSLRLYVSERSLTGTTKHVKLIVVDRAPALFVIRCGDGFCKDGEHDITREVMLALRERKLEHEGESDCNGASGAGSCGRSITYRMVAEYARPTDPVDPSQRTPSYRR